MKKIIVLACCAITLTACQKVINIDLNNTAPQYVIEAQLREGMQDTFKVHIAKTTSYFAAQTASTINAAIVTLTTDNGTAITLAPVGNGDYQTTHYLAQSQHTYTLKVVDGDKTFVASSYMPALVALDSVVATQPPPGAIFGPPNNGTDGTKQYIIMAYFKDPQGAANYYRGIVLPAAKDNNGYTLTNDKGLDGADLSLFFSQRFAPGTPITVQLLSLDKSTYNYFNQLDEFVGRGQQSVSPANPDSNWSGGALGYFGAVSINSRTVILQ